MRTRIALTLGAFLIAGGALTGTALASAATPPPTAAPTVTSAPTSPRSAPAPTETAPPTQRGTSAPTAKPAPTVARAGSGVVPHSVPAGPTGDLHLPSITEGD